MKNLTISKGWINEKPNTKTETFYADAEHAWALSHRVETWVEKLKFSKSGRVKIILEYTDN